LPRLKPEDPAVITSSYRTHNLLIRPVAGYLGPNEVVGGVQGRNNSARRINIAEWLYGVRFGTAALQINPITERKKMKQLLNNLLNDESGQDLIEYALIAALIALVAITGLNGLATKINSEFTAVGNGI
jgi:pilus assembly protein Flp/PilA